MFSQDDNQNQPMQDNPGMGPMSMPNPTNGDDGMPPPLDPPAAPSAPAPDFNTPELSTGAPAAPSTPASDDANDLVGIKQQALQHLSPLVSHLEQTPEEKFRTTMMMIQASDDQSLIKTAFEAAQAIEDDKARAQALLDVINEINYFTQHHNN
jgi:hypothetical protein